MIMSFHIAFFSYGEIFSFITFFHFWLRFFLMLMDYDLDDDDNDYKDENYDDNDDEDDMYDDGDNNGDEGDNEDEDDNDDNDDNDNEDDIVDEDDNDDEDDNVDEDDDDDGDNAVDDADAAAERHRHCGAMIQGTNNVTSASNAVDLQFHSDGVDNQVQNFNYFTRKLKGFWFHFRGRA